MLVIVEVVNDLLFWARFCLYLTEFQTHKFLIQESASRSMLNSEQVDKLILATLPVKSLKIKRRGVYSRALWCLIWFVTSGRERRFQPRLTHSDEVARERQALANYFAEHFIPTPIDVVLRAMSCLVIKYFFCYKGGVTGLVNRKTINMGPTAECAYKQYWTAKECWEVI